MLQEPIHVEITCCVVLCCVAVVDLRSHVVLCGRPEITCCVVLLQG